MPDMKVAALIPATGSPGTLATTAFTCALVEGLAANGVQARVVGLTAEPSEWRPDALGECPASGPWLPPTRLRLSDALEAKRRGVFDASNCDASIGVIRWKRELLLERELDLVAGDDPDVVLYADTRSLELMRIVLRIAQRRAWRVVVLSNEALIDRLIEPSTRDAYVALVAGCASGIWCVSEHLASFWRSRGVAPERIVLAPLITQDANFRAASAPPRAGSAVYLGNLAHEEIARLLTVAKDVSQLLPGFSLRLYGDSSEAVRAELLQRIVRDRLEEVVQIEPSVVPADVPDVLATADVLLLPRSSGEFSDAGFPNKVGEYLASGRPVVVTAVGDIPKYLTDGVHARVVAPDRPADFTQAVVELLRSPEVADAMGVAGRQRALELFSSAVVAERLVAFIESLPAVLPCSGAAPSGSTYLWRSLLSPDGEVIRRDLRRIRRRLGLMPSIPSPTESIGS